MTESTVRGLVARELPTARLGTALAAIALVATVLGLVLQPDDPGTVGPWPVVALACAAVMFGLAAFQAWAWGQALRPPGEADRVDPWRRTSFWVLVVSYPVVLLGMFAMLTVMVRVSFADGRALIMVFAVVALVLAQILGPTHHVRDTGPPGTIPGLLQRLSALSRRRVDPPDRPETPNRSDRPETPNRSDETSVGD